MRQTFEIDGIKYAVEHIAIVGSRAKGYATPGSDVDYTIIVTMLTHPHVLFNNTIRKVWDKNKPELLKRMLTAIGEIITLPDDISENDVKIVELSQFITSLTKQGLDELVQLHGESIYCSGRFDWLQIVNRTDCIMLNTKRMTPSVLGTLQSHKKTGKVYKSAYMLALYTDVVNLLNTEGNLVNLNIKKDRDTLDVDGHLYGDSLLPLFTNDVEPDKVRIQSILKEFYTN